VSTATRGRFPAARAVSGQDTAALLSSVMKAASFDHLVGAGEHDRRDIETQNLEVDHELELVAC
jgi:hypothetical protein